jgi:hypothetical protein
MVNQPRAANAVRDRIRADSRPNLNTVGSRCRENQTVEFFNQRITAPLSIYFVAVYFLGMWSGGTVVGFVKRAYQQARGREEQKRA